MLNIWRRAVDTLLTRAEQDQVVAAIGAAEAATSGEIKVHIERQRVSDPLARVAEVFARHGLDRVPSGAGVLLYISTSGHHLAFWAGPALMERVGQELFPALVDALGEKFRQRQYLGGLLAAIGRLGDVLHEHFPVTADAGEGHKNIVPNTLGGDE